MTISYGVTCNNEVTEIKRLISFLVEHKRDVDEIVVLQDSTHTNKEVMDYLTEMLDTKQIQKYALKKLNKDFAGFKNHLKSMCTNDYLFQIDADEEIGKFLITNLPEVIKLNDDIDMFVISRVNRVEGLTPEDISKWGWNVNTEGYINFPDYQSRILRVNSDIKWEGKVHERLVGYKNYTPLPTGEEWALQHNKDIIKQRIQNQFYETI